MSTTADTPLLVLPVQGPLDDEGRLVHAEDPAAQLALALVNLERALATAGLAPAGLRQVTVHATDVDLVLGVLDTLTDRFREVGADPVTTVVGARALTVPGQVVALDARAARATTPTSTDRRAPTRKRRTTP